tara:strand:- start:153 stop:401 length:249 start_codon:yes stop_codon:yes gene_type:complete
LASGELVRVALEPALRDPDLFGDRMHALAPSGARSPRTGPLVNRERFRDDLGYRQSGIERSEWILENHLNVAPKITEVPLRR